MGRSLKAGTVLLALVWGLGCSGAAETDAAADQAESVSQLPDEVLLAAVKVGLPPAGITRADLPDPESQGALLVEQYCAAICHAIPAPGSHSSSDWPAVVRRMWLRTSRVTSMVNVTLPDVAERIIIVQYLLDNALQVSSATLPEAPGRNAFTATCGRCHALPDPAQHSPADWPAVVLRMKTRMETMLDRTLSQDEMQRIVRFLERVSGA